MCGCQASIPQHAVLKWGKAWVKLVICSDIPSLVPRPQPLTSRNGLVNQVEFLGLAHTFVTVSLT